MARPVHVLECAFGSDPDAGLGSQAWTDISAYLDVQAGVRVTRGRTDEFSDIQPSTLGLTLKNVDGRFTMGNGSSPYSPNVVPGKKIRYGLMWPGGGVNLAPTPTTAAGLLAFWGPAVGATLTESTTGPPPVGTMGLAITWAGTAGPSAPMTLRGLVIGHTYTAQARLRIPSAQGGPHCRLTVGATNGSPTTALDTWQTVTVTFTATANSHVLQVTPVSTPVAGGVCRVNATQVEEAASAGTFVNTAGVFAWRFTGDVNEWPLGWGGGPGLFAQTNLTASDTLAKLGDLGEFGTMLAQSALVLDPVAYYPLTEAAAASSAADLSDNAQPAATLVQIGSGGSITFGSPTYTVAGVDFPSQPPYYAAQGGETGAWFAPASAGNGKFLRAILNAPTTGPGASVVMFGNAGGGTPPGGTLASMQAADGSYVSLERDSGTFAVVGVFCDGATGTRTVVTTGAGFPADMQQFAVCLTNLGTGNWKLEVFRNAVSLASSTFAMTRAMPAWTTVSIGGRLKDPFAVIAGHVQFYDYAVAQSDLATQSWAAALGQTGQVESTVDRITALKRFAGLDSLFVLGTGVPKNAGPGEIAGNPLDALKKVAATEGGLFLIRTDGFPTFHLAQYRYNVAATLTITADKIDPSSTFRGDNFGVFNDVQATGGTGLVGRAVNNASRAAYGRRKGTVDTLGSDVPALFSSAARIAYGFGTATNRMTGMRLSLLNQPALIGSVLGLDIGQKVLVTGFPSQAPAASQEVFVEGYSETVSEDDWSITFNTSPAAPWNVWQLGVAGRSELGSTTVLAY